MSRANELADKLENLPYQIEVLSELTEAADLLRQQDELIRQMQEQNDSLDAQCAKQEAVIKQCVEALGTCMYPQQKQINALAAAKEVL